MQFEIDDTVVHPAYGIGEVIDIEEKKFNQQGTKQYYKVKLPRRTLWLPVETQETSGLRLITAKSQLDQYRVLLKSPPMPLEQNHHRRHLELTDRLKEGTFQVLCEVVRDLSAWGWEKPLGPTDASILQKIRQNLAEEWATAAGISTPEATKEINALLQVAQKAAVK
jgi:CarD family transcriptional regulator